MLGLSSGLMTSSTWSRELVFEYTSDFTSSVDGWEAVNVEGTPTIKLCLLKIKLLLVV